LRQLDDGPRQAAQDLIEEMTEEGPELLSAPELRASPDTWRVRFHDRYRMIYQVSKDRKHIYVTGIRTRRVAYKGMKQ
jgi:mRNA-degrading endonuclease RelE of RelBE toxin-antitoxin system